MKCLERTIRKYEVVGRDFRALMSLVRLLEIGTIVTFVWFWRENERAVKRWWIMKFSWSL